MLTRATPDLPTDLPAILRAPLSGKLEERMAQIEERFGTITDEHYRLMQAVRSAFDLLNTAGFLAIADATIDGTPIGASSASTGKFTSLEATSTILPSGSVTPSLTFGGAAVGLNADKQVGSYVKIGGFILGNAWLRLTAKGASAGVALLTGLPVAARNNDDSYAAVAFYAPQVTFTGQLQGYVNKGASTIVIEQVTEGGVRSQLTDANFANNSELVVSFLYRAT